MNLNDKDIKILEQVTDQLDAWQYDTMVTDCLHIGWEVDTLRHIVAKLKDEKFECEDKTGCDYCGEEFKNNVQ